VAEAKLILQEAHRFEAEIKRSRFIAHAYPVADADAAMQRLDAVRDPEATHNCWAFRCGERYRFSDDGEPGGSAGRPILAAIDGQGVDQVLVVVVRHFGGTKLGVGGLVRAYGNTAASCLREAPKAEVRHLVTLRIFLPFAEANALYLVLQRVGGEKGEEDYGADGLRLAVSLDAALVPDFVRQLNDACRGKAQIAVDDAAAG